MTAPSEWVTFFKDAGIPQNVASKYGVSFAENRISMNMLGDLNKEYLRDMGITLTGDIIQILKHAKDVGGRLATDKALEGSSSKREVAVVSSAVLPTTLLPKKTLSSVGGTSKSTSALPKAATVVAKRQLVSAATVSMKKPAIAKSVSTSSITTQPDAGVSQRLGPPQTKSLAPKSVNFADERRGIFDRLGSSTDTPAVQSSESAQLSAFSRLDAGAAFVSDAAVENPTKVAYVSTSLNLKRKSDPVEFGDIKRTVLSSETDGEFVCGIESATSSLKTTKKRLILVRTLPDGSQERRIISDDDPILRKVPIKKQVVPASRPSSAASTSLSRPSAATTTSFRFDNFRIEQPVASFKHFPDSTAASIKSNFRADTIGTSMANVPAKQRVSLRQSFEDVRPSANTLVRTTATISGRLTATTSGNSIKNRLSQPELSRSNHPKRISPPRFDDRSNIRPTKVVLPSKFAASSTRFDERQAAHALSASDIKSRLSKPMIEDRRLERTPQRKPITGPDSRGSTVYDRLGY